MRGQGNELIIMIDSHDDISLRISYRRNMPLPWVFMYRRVICSFVVQDDVAQLCLITWQRERRRRRGRRKVFWRDFRTLWDYSTLKPILAELRENGKE